MSAFHESGRVTWTGPLRSDLDDEYKIVQLSPDGSVLVVLDIIPSDNPVQLASDFSNWAQVDAGQRAVLRVFEVARPETPAVSLDITQEVVSVELMCVIGLSTSGDVMALDLRHSAGTEGEADDTTLISVYRWDREANTIRHVRDIPGDNFYANISADGTLLVAKVFDNGENEDVEDDVHVIRIDDGEVVATYPRVEHLNYLCFRGPDVLATFRGHLSVVRLRHDPQPDEVVWELGVPAGYHVISQDGAFVACQRNDDNIVVLDLDGRRFDLVLPVQPGWHLLTMGFRGNTLLMVTSSGLWQWDWSSRGTQYRRLWAAPDPLGTDAYAEISANGETVIVSVTDDNDGEVRVLREESVLPPPKMGRYLA